MRRWGVVTLMVLDAIDHIGPATAAEIAAYTKIDREVIRKTCLRLATESAKSEQRVHIDRWVHDAEGERAYPRPVYAAGKGRNVRRPTAKTRSRIAVEWKQRRRKLVRSNFVFNLGMTV